jgi:hypothetical protein
MGAQGVEKVFDHGPIDLEHAEIVRAKAKVL